MGVADVTDPIRLYLDEMIPAGLSDVLNQYGYDVLSVKKAEMFGKSDEDQLAFAASNERAIITFNIKDYIPIHQSWLSEGKTHFGIIVSPETNISRLIHLCLRLLGRINRKEFTNQVRFLQEFL